jgi:hypothetical protein
LLGEEHLDRTETSKILAEKEEKEPKLEYSLRWCFNLLPLFGKKKKKFKI